MTERLDPNDLFEEMPEKKVNMAWRSHGGAPDLPTRWCVKGVIPETGVGILSGQWGTFKTTIALDVSLAVTTGAPFADRYRVKRQGAVAYVALEGANMMGTRLSALAKARGVTGPLPFFWCDSCPSLTAPNAANEIVAALHHLQLAETPLSLIWIDTIAAAAGYSKSGDDNDAAVTQRVMNTLSSVARQTGSFVIGIDHFGKVVDTGTRGSSAKEGAVDTVLAALGSRDLNGSITETRLALRKQRDGISGTELPYAAEVIETGRDEDGDPITAIALTWNEPTQTKGDTPPNPGFRTGCGRTGDSR
jgi:RecA-family ATPase